MVSRVIIIGCDVAGPSNVTDSAMMIFEVSGLHLHLLKHYPHFSDHDFCNILSDYHQHSQCVIGLDAPLSYNLGGGDRPADAELRRRLIDAGLKSGTVMPPTFTRMVFLTLRGMNLARLALQLCPSARIVEVHPAGAMALRGAEQGHVQEMKKSRKSRDFLQVWLEDQGLKGCQQLGLLRDHDLAAAAAALAAWKWSTGQAAWCAAAQPPYHPFDYAC